MTAGEQDVKSHSSFDSPVCFGFCGAGSQLKQSLWFSSQSLAEGSIQFCMATWEGSCQQRSETKCSVKQRKFMLCLPVWMLLPGRAVCRNRCCCADVSPRFLCTDEVCETVRSIHLLARLQSDCCCVCVRVCLPYFSFTPKCSCGI